MNEIKLLDCTLRDGGYLNDWEFGSDNLVSVFERQTSSGADIIEVGFLDERRTFDINRSIMPSTDCVRKIFGKVDKKQAMIVGMIDYGTCGLTHIENCKDSYLDGIRVIFKKHLMHEAIAFCGEIKKLGYKVFAQAVSITSYSDEELLELVRLVNDVEIYAMSMVDTYGLLYKDNLMHYFVMLDQYLKPEIKLGYHAHNNFQLAYSNCMEVLRHQTKRTIVVDATLYGMGKSAGNAPIELLSMHLNECYGKNYDINQMLEAIDGNIMRFYQKTPWGYNLFYYLAASNRCHPNYVRDLMDNHTLSIKSVNEILSRIIPEKKLMYDAAHIEQLYYEYQQAECDDSTDREILAGTLKGKTILVLGPGVSIEREQDKVECFMRANNPVVISINFIPEHLNVDYVFLSNPRRYIRLFNALKEGKNKDVSVIATSNVTKSKGAFHYTLNNSALLDKNAVVMDYSFIMLLKAFQQMGIFQIFCAGLDGYSEDTANYAATDMEYWFARRNAFALNKYVREYLKEHTEQIKVNFITKTRYLE
ncbi:aldolase catalytic domain-containing protein [Lachnospiraceae bacterium 42-17]